SFPSTQNVFLFPVSDFKFKLHTKITALVLVFSFFALLAQAQVAAGKKDTLSFPVDSTKFPAFNEEGFSFFAHQTFPLQHPLDGFQIFRPRGMGANGGQANINYSFPEFLPVGFRRSVNQYSMFGFSPLRKRFYAGDRPYTAIDFFVSQGKDQQVRVIHAHPLGKDANIALGFTRVRSEGFYQRQNTSNTSINLNGWYISKNRRYRLIGDAIWTGIANAENGGLVDDDDFEITQQPNRRLIPVNLSSAQTKQRERNVWIKQSVSFGPVVKTVVDKDDSTKTRTLHFPIWAISHSFKLTDQDWTYIDLDPTSGFYSTIYQDSTITRDSTHLWKAENALWFELLERKKEGQLRFLNGQIGVRHEFGEIKNDTIKQEFGNFILSARAVNLPSEKYKFNFSIQGDYVLQGTNAGDYQAQAKFVSFIGEHVLIIPEIQVSGQQAEFLYQRFSGNHFRWQNDFAQVKQERASVAVNFFKLFTLRAVGFHTSMPLYFDSTGLPVQFNGDITGVQIVAGFEIHKKNFHTWANLRYTEVPDNQALRISKIQAIGSIYYDGFVFKKALRLQAGVDYFFRTGYFMNGWLPSTAQFYAQSNKKAIDYVYLDPWVSIKVKPVRVFVKADHVNAGLFGRKYYETLHQPQNDFVLRIGISWVFND
ncbi:MAG: putative porin, partial [Bacteroidia bacterium]